jgi:hypothetical protein
MFSEEELNCIALLLDEEERKSRKRKWVHEFVAKKSRRGIFYFHKEFVEDSVRLYQYFRMSESMYLNVLSLIEEDSMKKNITFREAISPREKLAVCLR